MANRRAWILRAVLTLGATQAMACAQPCTDCPDVSGQYDVSASKACARIYFDGTAPERVVVFQEGSQIQVGHGDSYKWWGTLLDDGSIEFTGGDKRLSITGGFSGTDPVVFEGEYKDVACIADMRWERQR